LTKTTAQISFPDSEIECELLSLQQRAPVEKQKSSNDPTDYLNKIRQRDPELAKGYGQIDHPLSIQTADGPQKLNCTTACLRSDCVHYMLPFQKKVTL
jgi:hypothetical protein